MLTNRPGLFWASLTGSLALSGALLFTAMPASAQTFAGQSIAGNSVIFYPGDAPDAASLGGTAPDTFALNSGASRVLTFSNVTGVVSFNGGANFNDADGLGNTNTTNISSLNSISGINFTNRAGYLVGVFVNGTPSGAAPATLSYTTDAFSSGLPSYSPLIDQTFFIGDGVEGDGGGATQQFVVPTGATELVLGFADAPSYTGTPGFYGDNSGTLTASFSISGAASAPEPAALVLLVSAVPVLGGLVVRRRRQSLS